MSVNKRMRELRCSLGLNQTDFGRKIGLKQAIIGQMENGARDVAERTVLAICNVYHVNESWLRTGDGEVFVKTDDSLFCRFADEHDLDEVSRSAMLAFANLPENDRRTVLSALRAIADACDGSASDLDIADRIITERFQNQK